MSFKIQTINGIDTENLISLYEQCFDSSYKNIFPDFVSLDAIKKRAKNNLLQTIKNAPENILIATDAATIIGFLVIKSLGCSNIEIVSLYVNPAFKRQGVASTLIKHAINAIKKATVSVFENNYPAINLYHKLNFQEQTQVKQKNILGVPVINFCYTK